LVDFIADFTPGATEQADLLEGWILNVDEGSNSKGGRHRDCPHRSRGSIIKQSFTLGFPSSNNEAEYKAVRAGLRAAITLKVTGI